MRTLCILQAFVLLTACKAWNQESQVNVNSRYTVESVDVPTKVEPKLSNGLRSDLQKIVGAKFDQGLVDELSQRLRQELRGYRVVQKIVKGTRPESIRVVYDVIRSRRETDVVLPRLAYHSKQNFTFGVDADIVSGSHRVSAGILTDHNELVERYSGIRAGYHRALASGKVEAGFVAESWRSQWEPAVEAAVAENPEVPGIYRKRQHFEPHIRIELVPGLRVQAGVSVQRFQIQFPAARYETSNALISSLRYEQRWRPRDLGTHTIEAGYNLRAATQSLDSDYIYTRHAVDVAYRLRAGKEAVRLSFLAGRIGGRAPLFERFVLGNANTLRGYNKYDIAPAGGSRVAHGSVDYRHSWFRVVYDTGTVYDRSRPSKVRHSIAAGLTTGLRSESFSLLVAFPLREGRAEPIFIVGMNF